MKGLLLLSMIMLSSCSCNISIGEPKYEFYAVVNGKKMKVKQCSTVNGWDHTPLVQYTTFAGDVVRLSGQTDFKCITRRVDEE